MLVHGMKRSPLSLLGLATDLYRRGHRPELFAYAAALEPFNTIRDRLQDRLHRLAVHTTEYAVIGHSLGGIFLRAAMADHPQLLPAPAHLITLGTPTQVPRLAQRAQRLPLYRWLTGDAGERLVDTQFLAELPQPVCDWTAISGTVGWYGSKSPFGTDPNDGVVAVEETKSAFVGTHVEVRAPHTLLMNNGEVRTLIARTLQRSTH